MEDWGAHPSGHRGQRRMSVSYLQAHLVAGEGVSPGEQSVARLFLLLPNWTEMSYQRGESVSYRKALFGVFQNSALFKLTQFNVYP